MLIIGIMFFAFIATLLGSFKVLADRVDLTSLGIALAFLAALTHLIWK